jgi:hypothetical protein
VASFFQFCPKQAGDREACKIQAQIQASARDASDLSKKTGLRPGNKATSSDLFDSVAHAAVQPTFLCSALALRYKKTRRGVPPGHMYQR